MTLPALTTLTFILFAVAFVSCYFLGYMHGRVAEILGEHRKFMARHPYLANLRRRKARTIAQRQTDAISTLHEPTPRLVRHHNTPQPVLKFQGTEASIDFPQPNRSRLIS